MRVEPPASLVDWGVLVAVGTLFATGVASLFAATPRLAWVYGVHATTGLGLPVLLVWKLRRVRGRLAPDRWTRSTAASVAALALTLAALATGVYWAVAGWFTVGPFTGLTLHAVLGLLVAVPLLVHLAARWRTPRTDPDAARRAAVGYSAVAAVGLGGYLARKRVSAALGTLGRFTESKRVAGERLSHGHGFPLRLVAPDRRGFQWVKWVEEVEVRTTPDYGQWVAIFTSGLD